MRKELAQLARAVCDYLKWEQMQGSLRRISDIRAGLDGMTNAHARIDTRLSCYVHLEMI